MAHNLKHKNLHYPSFDTETPNCIEFKQNTTFVGDWFRSLGLMPGNTQLQVVYTMLRRVKDTDLSRSLERVIEFDSANVNSLRNLLLILIAFVQRVIKILGISDSPPYKQLCQVTMK